MSGSRLMQPAMAAPGREEHKASRLVRLAAMRRCLWLQHLWSSEAPPDPHREALALLRDPTTQQAEARAFYASDSEASELSATIEAAEADLAEDEAWSTLRIAFGLSTAELHLLAVCVAAESDPDLRRVYGYLLDQASPADASLWLALRLFDWNEPTRLHPFSPIYRWRLAGPVENQAHPWSLAASWAVDPTVADFLRGVRRVDPTIAAAFENEEEDSGAGWPCLYQDVADAAVDFLGGLSNRPACRTEMELASQDGSGRRTLAAQIGSRLGRRTLAIDCRRLVPSDARPEEAEDRLARAVRTVALLRVLPFWKHADDLPAFAWQGLRGFSGLHFFGVRSALTVPPEPGVVRRRFELPALSRADRVDLWERLTGGEAPLPIQEWSLRPAEIVAAAQVAPLGAQAVVEACGQRLLRAPGELFQVLPCPYEWNDLVLAPAIEGHLKEFEVHASMRGAVYDEWGFARHCPLGQGVSALFAGPSGTGKTMAAQVLARSLGLQLYKVDLAGLLNKYVGETEKRIRVAFEQCDGSNAMLFFDEADALFGGRVQNRDAHSRFVNIEIDYLLQQMEQFDGLAILATNRKQEIDSAFFRRLRFVVDFVPPNPPERLRLWKHALPETSPRGEPLLEEIEWQALATKLNLTGAEIKAAAIGAAFLARKEGSRIGMRHVLAAVRRELTKQGQVLRPGEWEAQWRS